MYICLPPQISYKLTPASLTPSVAIRAIVVIVVIVVMVVQIIIVIIVVIVVIIVNSSDDIVTSLTPSVAIRARPKSRSFGLAW